MRIYAMYGELRPKKNSMKIVKVQGSYRPVHDRKLKENWFSFVRQARAAWDGPPIDEPTVVHVRFLRRNRRKVDPTNLCSALADILEDAGVFTDDRYAYLWPHFLEVDAENPRVEWWIDPSAA